MIWAITIVVALVSGPIAWVSGSGFAVAIFLAAILFMEYLNRNLA